MKTYKVWITVEEHNDRTDEYTDVDLPFAEVAKFKRESAAVDFAGTLQAIGDILDGCPPWNRGKPADLAGPSSAPGCGMLPAKAPQP